MKGGYQLTTLTPVAEFLVVIGTKVSSLPFTDTSTICFSPPPPPRRQKRGLKLVCNVNSVCEDHIKPENSQDYAQKPQRNCTLLNSASACVLLLWFLLLGIFFSFLYFQHCFKCRVGGCWERTHDRCDFGIGCQTF
jgi:hypothetical protein